MRSGRTLLRQKWSRGQVEARLRNGTQPLQTVIRLDVSIGSIVSSLTSLRHVRSGSNLGNGGRPVWARRKRAFAHPEAPRLQQNNPTGRIPLNPSGKSALPAPPALSPPEGGIAIVPNGGGGAGEAREPARVRHPRPGPK